MRIVSQKQADAVFKDKGKVLGESMKQILKKNDTNALKGIQSLSSFMNLNTALNNGSGVISYIIEETRKKYNSRSPMPKIKLRDIIKAFPGFTERKIVEVLDGLEKMEFIEYIEDAGINPRFKKHPDYTYVRLLSIWDRYLKQYQIKTKESDTFIESIGRILWMSILENNGGKSGIRSFKVLIMILENISSDGEISKDDCEKYCCQMGAGRFAQLIASDSQKNSEIKFFVKSDKNKVKINKNTIDCYRKYIIPLYQNLTQEQGLSI